MVKPVPVVDDHHILLAVALANREDHSSGIAKIRDQKIGNSFGIRIIFDQVVRDIPLSHPFAERGVVDPAVTGAYKECLSAQKAGFIPYFHLRRERTSDGSFTCTGTVAILQLLLRHRLELRQEICDRTVIFREIPSCPDIDFRVVKLQFDHDTDVKTAQLLKSGFPQVIQYRSRSCHKKSDSRRRSLCIDFVNGKTAVGKLLVRKLQLGCAK